MALTIADSDRMIRAAIAKAEELNIKVSVAVCDAGGRLLAFNRMDGANWISGYAAQGKAVTSVALGAASGILSAESANVQGIVAAEGGHMLPAQGALPVFKNGELIGAVGGSGATSQEDEDCARAGIAAL